MGGGAWRAVAGGDRVDAVKRWCLAAVLAVAAAHVAAHDFWIEASNFTPQPGDAVQIRLRVGERLAGEPVTRPAADGFRSFALDDGQQRRAVAGRVGADPAGLLRIAAGPAPLQIVVYHSRPIPIEIELAKFTAYLKEEGLESVVEQRAARGDTDKPGREVYARNAKALLRVGDAAAGGESGDRALGLPLELVAERNPYALRSGDELPLQLLHRGQPLAGVQVVAMSRVRPAAAVFARSDAQGRVRLKLDDSGLWLVKAVHMLPAADPAQADWESQWASLTFELPPPRP